MPRPMTTGMKMTPRVNCFSRVFCRGEQRQQEAGHHQHRRDEDGVLEGEEERRAEGGVAERLGIVGEADETATAEQRRAGQRDIDQLAERIEHEGGDENSAGRM